jgi:hypothetical protein
MTWPEVDRREAPFAADERMMLEGWLDFHRATLLTKCAGLAGAQLAERSCPPSGLSLLGLVRHLTAVEQGWFRGGWQPDITQPLYFTPEDPDLDFNDTHPDRADDDLAIYLDEVAKARAEAAKHGLDETVQAPWRAHEVSLRWIYLHMIEEYARHNGHADLIRERIDGVTGE